jgi:CDP-paratose 2-epimerase
MKKSRTILVTGGAGFIGVHTALHFAKNGWAVHVIDNLSRQGTQHNLEWLQNEAAIEFSRCDLRDYEQLKTIFKRVQPDVVIHLAAQVAVTTSVRDPREDFEINALGTFNLLECIRNDCPGTFLINASTNKVYGKMEMLNITERNGRYEYADLNQGIPEEFPLDFHSPYGCSKGTADQYTLDYARIYGLRTTTFRQSCIYGTRQFGIEDQGWVAWFSIAATLGKHISVFGDGKQTRDVLHVKDLVAAYSKAIEKQSSIAGQAFNIGGGPSNTLSLLELLEYLKRESRIPLEYSFHGWRPGDQLTFVCNIQKAKKFLDWEPKMTVEEGVTELIQWTSNNSRLFDFLNK